MRVVGGVMAGSWSDAPLTSTDFVTKASSLKPQSQSGVAEPSPPRGHLETICPTSQPALNKRQLDDDDAPAQQFASQNLTPLNRKKTPPTLGRIRALFVGSENTETVTSNSKRFVRWIRNLLNYSYQPKYIAYANLTLRAFAKGGSK